MLLFIASKSHHQCQLLLSESCLFLSPAYLCKTMTQTIASLLKECTSRVSESNCDENSFFSCHGCYPTDFRKWHLGLRKNMIQVLKLSVLGLSSKLFNLWMSGIFVPQEKIGNLMTSLPSASWKVAGLPKNPMPVLVSSPFSETRFLCPQWRQAHGLNGSIIWSTTGEWAS